MFAAALTIYLRPDLAVLDPVCTFVFSALVLATTISILRNTIAVIMEVSTSQHYLALANTSQH